MPEPVPIDFDHPPADPLGWFNRWFDEAKAAAARVGLKNPHAMTLATLDGPTPQGHDARPSARIVLLKSIDERGAVFYTNRESRKGLALKAHPQAALLFHWDTLDRQVRIEGEVTPTSDAESDAYFASRPLDSQLGAWASQQSRALEGGRAGLEIAVAEVMDRFADVINAGGKVPRPPHWGGYRVALESIEFWQGHPFRLHDRVVYKKTPRGEWATRRLYP
jgi:pyridoxamine 5'-phosphate oxidase